MPLPYIFRRAIDPFLPPAVIVLGALFGIYTSLYILLVERKPRLAFNLRHWSDVNSARLLRCLGPISFWLFFGWSFPACGIQDTITLSSHGLSPCNADSVVTFNILCWVASQESACKSLYSLLKPGGQWLVYEHVVVEQKYTIPRLLQHAYNMVWPFFLGGCNIKRDTAEVLKRAGTWDTVDLSRKNGEGGWEMLGHIIGQLVKTMWSLALA